MNRLRFLPLFWKILLPPLVLTLVLGLSGGFLLVRTATEQAADDADKSLFFRATAGQAHVRDRGAAIMDAARLAASLERLPEAVSDRDVDTINRVLLGVAAVRADVDIVAVVDADGNAIAGFVRVAGSLMPVPAGPLRPADDAFLVVEVAGVSVVSSTAAIAGLPERIVAGQAADRLLAVTSQRAGAQVALADVNGAVVGPVPRELAALVSNEETGRSTVTVDGRRLAVMTSPLRVERFDGWRIAVATPAASATVWGAGARFAVVLLAVVAAVVAFGALSTRALLEQVRAVLATKRAIGRGELTARAPVLADDEFGELATGLNDMAEQLAASYEDLERQVSVRSAELARMYEAHAQDAHDRADFFRGLSHELRNPLAVIAANAEVLSDPDLQFSSPGWREELGETILQSARHMAERVDTVLEMARLDATPQDLELRPIDLAAEVAAIDRMMSALANAAGVELVVDVPSGLPLVRAERQRLHEIVLNLVSNAAKYNQPGGHVAVSAREAKNSIVVSVTDNGRGIPQESLDQIFEPFYRVPGTQPQVGSSTGLGLALTRRLVEAHGGVIWVDTDLGAGSTFSFTLAIHNKPRRRSRRAVAARS